ncbi:fibrinogen-like protein A [Anopheles aquasalis]|uniref:fibrinogen-like protein A n=1 Tax=Anopheles aquasalis TaxID=42839 RepID=UPI00215A4F3E|nr:fibrinogen-like protein A [Anopheles aquasalis]
MKLRVGLIVFCAVLRLGASDRKSGGTKKSVSIGLELIMTKLEVLERKLQEIQNELNQHRSSQEQNQKEVIAALHKLGPEVPREVKDLSCQNSTQPLVSTPTMQNTFGDNDASQMQDYATTTSSSKQPPFSSCKAVPSTTSDTCLIRVKSDSEPFRVYCEQRAYGGGWIVIQYRYDGSLDFYRGWNEFRDGFGDLDKEFWLGLEKIHQITKDRKHELIVELKDFNGDYAYARYDAFQVGSESEGYVLKDLGSYNGTAGDAMTYNKGMKFTTKDRENDLDASLQCAHYREGAWWHNDCTDANLNGRYINANDEKSMSWAYFKRIFQGLGYSRMMIREMK